MSSEKSEPTLKLRRSTRTINKPKDPEFHYSSDDSDDSSDADSNSSSESPNRSVSLLVGDTVSESQMNRSIHRHALNSINIPESIIGSDSVVFDDTQVTIPETQQSAIADETFSQDMFSEDVTSHELNCTRLNAMAPSFVPSSSNPFTPKNSNPFLPPGATPCSSKSISRDSSPLPFPTLSPLRVTDSMLPNPTPATQKHQRAMADLFQANLEILALKEELRNLKEKALADNLAHAMEVEQLQISRPKLAEPEPVPNNLDQDVGTVQKNNDNLLLFRAYGNNHMLSNFCETQIKFEGQWFRSVEHAYQWKCAMFHREPRLAWKIKSAKSASLAKKLSDGISRSENWQQQKETLMTSLLRLKADHSPRFVSSLLSSNEKQLIHNVESNNYWGCGPDFCGQNKLGTLLENLRTELRNDPPDNSHANQDAAVAPAPRSPDLPPQKKVVIIGNSNARGISQELNDRDVVATGFTYPGATLNRLTQSVKMTTPKDTQNPLDAVVIMGGDIECKDGVPAANTVARYEHLIDEVRHTYPLTPLIIPGLPQAGNQHRRQTIREVNHRLEVMASDERLITFIANDNAKLRDSIHMTSSAKCRLSATISNVVKKFF